MDSFKSIETEPVSSPSPALPRRMTKRKIDSFEIQTLTAPHGSDVNLYETVIEIAKKTVVAVKVPEAIVQSENGAMTLVAMEKGTVSVVRGMYTLSKFFELVDVSLSRPSHRDQTSQTPKYLIRTFPGRWVLSTSREDCLSELARNAGRICCISRFVKVKGEKPLVFRVSYRAGKGVAVYQIKNNRRIDSLRNCVNQRKEDFPTRQISIYQHNALSYRYAGKLLKASFSPYLPYKSVLTPRSANSAKVSPRLTPLRPRPSTNAPRVRTTHTSIRDSSAVDALQFIVTTSELDQCKVYKIEDKVPELEDLMSAFLAALERAYKTKTVAELTIDCVNGEDGEWYAIDSWGLQWIEDGKRQVQERNIKKRFRNIDKMQRETMEVKVIEPITFSHSLSEKTLTPTSISLSPRPSCLQETLTQRHLLTVQSKFDDLLSQARKSRVLSRNLVSELEAVQKRSFLVEHLLDNALVRVVPEETRSNRKEFASLRETLMEILSGQVKNVLWATRLAMFRKLGMTEGQYENLISEVVREAQGQKVSGEILELITERLKSFLVRV